MRNILKLIRLFLWNSKLKLSRCMEYRMDFIAGSLITLFYSSISPILQYLIFTQTRGFPGWTLEEIILFQGVLLTVVGVRNLVFGDLHGLVLSLVHRGDFDRLLLKPYPSIGIILASSFSPNSVGSILSGVFITVYSVNRLNLTVGLLQISLFFASIIFGLILFMGLEVLFSSTVLVLVNIGRLDQVMNGLVNFGAYPLEIFTRVVKIVFITVVPFAIWVNIPARALLNTLDISFLSAFVFSILFFLASLKIWNMCIGRYTSAGG